MLTEGEDYVVYKKLGRIDRVGGCWTTNRIGTDSGIKLSGSYGYSSTPGHITEMCITIAKVISNLDKKTVLDESGADLGAISEYIPSRIYKDLKKERRIVV